MISSNMDPKLAANVVDTKDLTRFKNEMEGLKKNLAGGGEDTAEQLKKACRKFEAVFIGKLWEQMKQSVPKEGYLHSKQEENYMSMFDRDFSEKMADAGGIGLADMIYAQLSEKLKRASGETLSGGVAIKPLVPEPIALNPDSKAIPLSRQNGQGMTLEDWGGAETVNTSGGNGIAPGMGAPQAASEAKSVSKGLTDVEVQAKLDELTRKLESQRIREGLVDGANLDKQVEGYKVGSKGGSDGDIGRKLAEIG